MSNKKQASCRRKQKKYCPNKDFPKHKELSTSVLGTEEFMFKINCNNLSKISTIKEKLKDIHS